MIGSCAAGSVRPDDHCAIRPPDRVDVDELPGPDSDEAVLRVARAPAQTGKTSAFIVLRDLDLMVLRPPEPRPAVGLVGAFRGPGAL